MGEPEVEEGGGGGEEEPVDAPTTKSRSQRTRSARSRDRSVTAASEYPRRLRSEDKGDELTVFDATQWSEPKEGKAAKEAELAALGKAPEAAKPKPVKGEMVMGQAEEEPPQPAAALVGGAEAQEVIPGEELHGKAERDAYLAKRPLLCTGLRAAASVLNLIAVGTVYVNVNPVIESIQDQKQDADSYEPEWEGVNAVTALGLATEIPRLASLVGFLLFCHVGDNPDRPGARVWKKAWQVWPVMGDAACVWTLFFAALLAFWYGATGLDFCLIGSCGDLTYVPWVIDGVLLLAAAACHAAIGLILFKGRIL